MSKLATQAHRARTRHRATAGLRAAAAVVAVVGALALSASAAAQPPIVRPAGDPAAKPLGQLGAELYAGNCAACHGDDGEGVAVTTQRRGQAGLRAGGPPLVGVGALAADFYLSTGYMPLGDVGEQPTRSRSRFSQRERQALVDYVASIGSGPPVPSPQPDRGSVSEGLKSFTEHCAGCHQVVAEGGVVTGARVPPLDQATPVQVAEAVRIGPYLMPRFSESAISDSELDSIIAYVEYAKDPQDAGGWGINHLGPFPEGMVTWGIAVVALIGTCLLIGKRARRA